MNLPILALVVALVAGFLLVVAFRRLSSRGGAEEPDRLARLLVTELVLYNEDAVEVARRGGSLEGLQDEIDRVRALWEERVDPVEGTGAFDRALLEILGQADPRTAEGAEGPVVNRGP